MVERIDTEYGEIESDTEVVYFDDFIRNRGLLHIAGMFEPRAQIYISNATATEISSKEAQIQIYLEKDKFDHYPTANLSLQGKKKAVISLADTGVIIKPDELIFVSPLTPFNDTTFTGAIISRMTGVRKLHEPFQKGQLTKDQILFMQAAEMAARLRTVGRR